MTPREFISSSFPKLQFCVLLLGWHCGAFFEELTLVDGKKISYSKIDI
jgi:hypothetical protein